MALIPYIVAYVAVGVFLIACVARLLMWSKMPIHVRWELYPVAHEASRAHYGGSYLEEVDWWKKPRESSMIGELKVMIPEIFFLVALKEHNPKLWNKSFPFHFGLYLVIAATATMFFGAILGAISPSIITGGFGKFLQYVIMGCAYGGLGLGLLGALGLLVARMTDDDLKDFTAPADIFNLVFFIAAFGLTLAHALVIDPTLGRSTLFVYQLVTFNMGAMAVSSPLTIATVVMLGLLVAYVPMTHMSHFIGKYFAYHSIRWNDSPNTPGSHHEKEIGEVLQRPVSWAAPHIAGGGTKTWADVATEEQKKQ